MRDLPIKLLPDVKLNRLTLSPDFEYYNATLQRVIVFLLTHKLTAADGSSYSGWDITRRYTTGALSNMLAELDDVAAEMIRAEVSDGVSYINNIDITGQLVGNNAVVRVSVELLDGSKEEGQFTLNE